MTSEYHMTDKDKGTKDQVPIVKDSELGSGIKTPPSPTREQLAEEDMEAIDSGNIIDKRTRGASPTGKYTEPGDTEGLPENDGTSAIAS